MVEKRKHQRISCRLKTVIRKRLADHNTVVMEFISANLSLGGIFISSEDLSLFDLGEEISVLIEDEKDRFYEGRARVVRSARVFTEDKRLTESGYGLMFIDLNPEFTAMIKGRTEKVHIIL